MTFTMRTVAGGYITGLAALGLVFITLGDLTVMASYAVPAVVAALVAYYLVFTKVKNSSHRLGAAVTVAPIFLALAWALNESFGRSLAGLGPLLGIFASVSLVAAAFVVAVAVVAWVASVRGVKLVIS